MTICGIRGNSPNHIPPFWRAVQWVIIIVLSPVFLILGIFALVGKGYELLRRNRYLTPEEIVKAETKRRDNRRK